LIRVIFSRILIIRNGFFPKPQNYRKFILSSGTWGQGKVRLLIEFLLIIVYNIKDERKTKKKIRVLKTLFGRRNSPPGIQLCKRKI